MVVFLALACLAGQAPNAAESRFRRLDRDGSGFITANEAPRVAVTRGAAPSPGGAAWIRTYDRDGDGRVSIREYLAGPRAALRASVIGSAS